ncbi:hypothetical protein V8F33_006178 [Rhypophila sp. PSN 637]
MTPLVCFVFLLTPHCTFSQETSRKEQNLVHSVFLLVTFSVANCSVCRIISNLPDDPIDRAPAHHPPSHTSRPHVLFQGARNGSSNSVERR